MVMQSPPNKFSLALSARFEPETCEWIHFWRSFIAGPKLVAEVLASGGYFSGLERVMAEQ